MKFKEILEIAKSQFLVDMSPLENPDCRLEQVEYKVSEEIWDVIVSYLIPNTNKRSTPFAALEPITPEFQYFRIYKRLKIDNEKNIIGFYMYEKE